VSEWTDLVAALKVANEDRNLGAPDNLEGWEDPRLDGYWKEYREPGETNYHAQCEMVVNLHAQLVQAGEPVPEALRLYVPKAKQYLTERAKQVATLEAYEAAAQAEEQEQEAKRERRERRAQGRQAAPEPKAAERKNLERFWLCNKVFEMGLTSKEFLVYSYLSRRAGKSGVCWPSIVTIVAACRVDRKTVRRAVKRLRQLRMVAWKRGSFGRSSKYRLTDPTLWATPVTGPVGGLVTVASHGTSSASSRDQ